MRPPRPEDFAPAAVWLIALACLAFYPWVTFGGPHPVPPPV